MKNTTLGEYGLIFEGLKYTFIANLNKIVRVVFELGLLGTLGPHNVHKNDSTLRLRFLQPLFWLGTPTYLSDFCLFENST